MKISVKLGLAVTILAAALPASAATVRWNLVNVNFSDGGTATGYIVMDTNINNHILPDYQVFVSSGSQLTAFTYNPASAFSPSAVFDTQVTLLGFLNGGLVLTANFGLPYNTGTMPLAIGLGANYENRNPGYREIISGSLTTADVATPEPGSLALFFLGGSVLFARRIAANKRRRQ